MSPRFRSHAFIFNFSFIDINPPANKIYVSVTTHKHSYKGLLVYPENFILYYDEFDVECFNLSTLLLNFNI